MTEHKPPRDQKVHSRALLSPAELSVATSMGARVEPAPKAAHIMFIAGVVFLPLDHKIIHRFATPTRGKVIPCKTPTPQSIQMDVM
jgi:hypothetical protein